MKSALKILAGLAITFILLLVIAGILLPIIYDKEDLKNAIAREVHGQTGRELTIKGDQLTVDLTGSSGPVPGSVNCGVKQGRLRT